MTDWKALYLHERVEHARTLKENRELKAVMRDALAVLHQTGISKRDVADRMRQVLGMRPGQRLDTYKEVI